MPFSVASTLEKHMRKCVVGGKKPGLPPPHWAAGIHLMIMTMVVVIMIMMLVTVMMIVVVVMVMMVEMIHLL